MRRADIDDPDLPLAQMLQRWPETAEVFIRHRTLCVGCPIAPFHTVLDTCAEYRLDEAAFRAELEEAVERARSAPAEAAGGRWSSLRWR